MGRMRFAALAAVVSLALGFLIPLTLNLIHWLLTGGEPHQETRGDAPAVFDAVLPYERVLSSRFPRQTSQRACSHVFVRLRQNPPQSPPRPSPGTDRDHRFGGLWRPTPARFTFTPGADPLEDCRTVIGYTLTNRIAQLLRAPGAFHYHDLTDGTLHLYAPAARIARRLNAAAAPGR